MRAALHLSFRTIKWLSALLLTLVVAVFIGFYLFFDPNDFKPQISAFLSSQTGLPLTIEGQMEFSVVPWLGLRVENITLSQPAPFGKGKCIHVEELDLKIPLRDLLQKRLVIESLAVKGLTLNLVKNADGQTNWEFYAKNFEKTSKPISSVTPTTATSATPSASKQLSFDFKHFDIKEANVTFIDKADKKTWDINHVSLSGEYSATAALPITAKFNISLTPFKQKATLFGEGDLKGTIDFKKARRAINLKSNLVFTMPETPWKEVSLRADINGDLNNQLKIQALDLKLGTTHATGNVVFPVDASKTITFALVLNELNLNQWQTLPKEQKLTNSASTAATTSKVTKALPASASNQGENQRTFEGELLINTLQLKEYTLTNVSAAIHKKGSIVTMKPLTAQVFGAKLVANVRHDLDSPQTSTMQGRISDLAIQPLLRALKKPEKMSGTANIDFNLNQHPTALNGVVKCEVLNGAVEGIDIMYYLALAQSLLKKQANTASDSKHTAFNSLRATFLLHDNLVDNNDLAILGNDYKANAEGSINLITQTLSYKLKAFKIYSDGKEHTNAYPLAIRIKGPIQNPKIEPDIDVYMKTLINTHFDTEADGLVKKGLNKILGDDAAEAASKKEELEKKIGKEVGKGLKKIFKLP